MMKELLQGEAALKALLHASWASDRGPIQNFKRDYGLDKVCSYIRQDAQRATRVSLSFPSFINGLTDTRE